MKDLVVQVQEITLTVFLNINLLVNQSDQESGKQPGYHENFHKIKLDHKFTKHKSSSHFSYFSKSSKGNLGNFN